MSGRRVAQPRACWCGSEALADFGSGYRRCPACGTLVAQHALDEDGSASDSFYAGEYWRSHQQEALGLPGIEQRARADLGGRCAHWLQTVLAHRLPPARVLDVGCAHGAFVALLRWAGFDATGLELSGWAADFARRTFGVPVLEGRLEALDLPAASYDLIVLHDVVEHLEDPQRTLARVAGLLAPGGMAVVQTPCAPETASHDALARADDGFMKMLEEPGHLHLFSRRALRLLLERAGLGCLQFERPFFGYDMYLLAAREPVPDVPAAAAEAALQAAPVSRLVLALIDKARESESRRQRSIAQLLGPRLSRRLASVLRRLRIV